MFEEFVKGILTAPEWVYAQIVAARMLLSLEACAEASTEMDFVWQFSQLGPGDADAVGA